MTQKVARKESLLLIRIVTLETLPFGFSLKALYITSFFSLVALVPRFMAQLNNFLTPFRSAHILSITWS